jgi:hypothetical protein
MAKFHIQLNGRGNWKEIDIEGERVMHEAGFVNIVDDNDEIVYAVPQDSVLQIQRQKTNAPAAE